MAKLSYFLEQILSGRKNENKKVFSFPTFSPSQVLVMQTKTFSLFDLNGYTFSKERLHLQKETNPNGVIVRKFEIFLARGGWFFKFYHFSKNILSSDQILIHII